MPLQNLRRSEKRRLLEQVRDEIEKEHERREKLAWTLSDDGSAVYRAHVGAAWGERLRKRAERSGWKPDFDAPPNPPAGSLEARLLANIQEIIARCEELERLDLMTQIEKALEDKGLLPVLLPADVTVL